MKLKVLKKDENKGIRLAQNLTIGETDFNQSIRLGKQLDVAVKTVIKKENLRPVQVKPLAKVMEEQLKFTHKVLEVVERPHRKICVTMLRDKVENRDPLYVQVQLFGRRKEETKFSQFVYVNYKFVELNYLLDLMNSVFDIVNATESFLFDNVL